MYIIIGGYGDASRYLGRLLRTEGHEVAFVEKDEATASEAGGIDALVVNGDVCNPDTLKEAGIKVSGSKSELMERIVQADESVKIWDKIESDHEKLNEGKEIIQYGTYNDIRNMYRIFNSNNCNRALVGVGSLIEYSVIASDNGGITLKGRPDIITKDGLVVNYKTCVDANPETFMHKAFKMGYVLRAAFEYDMAAHILGEKPSGYMIVAQEKQAPFAVVRYVLGDTELEIGRQMYQCALDQYVSYIESGVASRYPEEVQFTLPDYMYNDSLEIEI